MKLQLSILTIALFISCGDTNESRDAAVTKPHAGTEDSAAVHQKPAVPAGTSVYKVSVPVEFAPTSGKEIFTVWMETPLTPESQVTFSILSRESDTLYTDIFPARMFDRQISPGEFAGDTAHIMERMNTFLEDENFRSVERKAMPHDPMVISRQLYQEIMSDTTRQGFIYHLGYENVKTIAWSPTRKKVILIHNCC